MATELSIAVFPGDGHGPSVIDAACRVLEAAGQVFGFSPRFTRYPYCGAHYLQTGELLPDRVLEELKGYAGILFGGVFHSGVEPGLLAREILLKITRHLDLYVSLRPVRLFPGVSSYLRNKGPQQIDYIVVRENSGGMDGRVGGVLLKGSPQEVAQETLLYTRHQVDRCLRFAFELASRPDRRGRLTLSGKSSLQPRVYDLWMRAFQEMGEAEFPGVKRDYYGVDDICMQMVRQPEAFDVIVTANLFGDILADIGAVSQGGIGYAAVGSLHPGRVGMYGPMRASPDFYAVSLEQANPIAAISAGALLLRQAGQLQAALSIEEALMVVTATEVIAEGAMLSRFRTDEVADMVAARIHR